MRMCPRSGQIFNIGFEFYYGLNDQGFLLSKLNFVSPMQFILIISNILNVVTCHIIVIVNITHIQVTDIFPYYNLPNKSLIVCETFYLMD